MPKKYVVRGLLAALVACVVLVAAIPGLRWRFQVVGLHLAGRIPDIDLEEVVAFMLPGSDQSLARLSETRNPHAVLTNKRTSEADISAGATTFRAQCADCHGVDARGGARGPALVGRALKAGESDWAIYRTIRLGVADTMMAPHPNLSPTQLWQLVGYVRAVDFPGSGTSDAPARTVQIDVPYDELRSLRQTCRDWLTYSGTYSGVRHSGLAQIDASNVQNLSVRWIRSLKTSTNMSPIVRDGIMFANLPVGIVAALDAATGRVIWERQLTAPDARGVALLGDKVLVATATTRLAALSASSGETLWETAVTDDAKTYIITSAPLVYRDLVLTGVATTEGGRGFVVALDAATGKERWRFFSVPAKGQRHNDSWSGDSWRNGGAPTWLTGTYDPELNLVFWPIGNPKPDYDANLRDGDNLYSNSVVALHGDTGEVAWHFQFTPADNRDWDSNQIPILIEQGTGDKQQKLLLLANRNGFYYVLDRQTGKFLHAEAFVKQNWTAGINSSGRPLPPPALTGRPEGHLVYPGNIGGTNWWPPSYDASLGLVFVPVIEQGMVFFRSSTSWPTASNRPFYTAIRALDAITGKLVWEQRNAPRTVRNRASGVVSTRGGLVFASDSTQFFALDSRTGERLWSMETGDYINAAPVVYEADGTEFVSIASGNNLLSFALVPGAQKLQDGKLMQTSAANCSGSAGSASQLVSHR